MDDLAAWLTQIWDEQEKAARFAIELTEQAYPVDEFEVRWEWALLTNHRTSGGGGQSFALGAPSPASVLARIAADRQILALHLPTPTTSVEVDGREVEPDSFEEIVSREVNCMACAGYPDAPCQTLRLLALPYADRPGYQEAWKPE